MRQLVRLGTLVLVMSALPTAAELGDKANGWKLIGWNDLGMHCMDADFSVLSILPPYNVIHAQLLDPSGNLVTDPSASGITVTYEGVADPDGSTNVSSRYKTNFWDWVLTLYGAALEPDEGLAGHDMPGSLNTPQPMTFDTSYRWFTGEGIPITPTDDAGDKQYYPMMLLVARDAAANVLATTRIVLPVSDEMTCISCHGSGSGSAARPSGGWVNSSNPEVDYRLNILLIHDDLHTGSTSYGLALENAGYNPAGLYATATADNTPVLCAACHLSNALPNTGQTGIAPLTQVIHSRHAAVTDPANGLTLDESSNRVACYACHPGSATRCLRGAMGNAVAASGELAIQCQSCHGTMSQVGAADRTGWFDQPVCQSCHTGTATLNNGQIRYLTAFDGPGEPRVAVSSTFATTPDTPAAGLSLYRFSTGHGGLQCEACHGSTHAVLPSSHRNDNLQSIDLQGHEGALGECAACHASSPRTVSGGPHGMHPVGMDWVERHEDAAESNPGQCRACHGADYRGTVLSRALGDRSLSTELGSKSFWRGFQIGCYTCHRGPSNENRNNNRAPVVSNVSVSTGMRAQVSVTLPASDADGDTLTVRIVSQPGNGTVGLLGNVATYLPFPDFHGSDSFTFAAWDGSTDSNLGTGVVTVLPNACTLSCGAVVADYGTLGLDAQFTGYSESVGCTDQPRYEWTFGDLSPMATGEEVSHSYQRAGQFPWRLRVTLDGVVCEEEGTIVIEPSPSQTRRATGRRAS